MNHFIVPQMQYMRERGWDVTVICNMRQSFIDALPEDFHYYNVPMQRSFNLWTAIKCTWRLYCIFKNEKYDMVQYAATHAALYSSFAAWFARIPIRVHLQWGIYNYSEMRLAGHFYKFVEWLTCLCSTDIRPVSHKNFDVAVREGLFKPSKGKVLGRGGTVGIDLSEYPLSQKSQFRSIIRSKWNIPDDAYVLGFVGRISEAKGNNELIEAFRMICRECPQAVLLLVGQDEGSVRRDLMAWVNDANCAVLTGPVSHGEIPHYMAAMDVLVHPTYREGFGMVLQEAMAMEIPIITTDIPGPSEVIEEGISGVLIPPHRVNELAEAMTDFCQHSEQYASLGQNGRARVEACFSRDVMLRQLYEDKEELYNQYSSRK